MNSERPCIGYRRITRDGPAPEEGWKVVYPHHGSKRLGLRVPELAPVNMNPLFANWECDGSPAERRKARQFYCIWYDQFILRRHGTASATCAFGRCLEILDDGHNMLIYGYGGEDWTATNDYECKAFKTVERLYLSDDVFFGHEMVLAVMLCWPSIPFFWPWRQYGLTYSIDRHPSLSFTTYAIENDEYIEDNPPQEARQRDIMVPQWE